MCGHCTEVQLSYLFLARCHHCKLILQAAMRCDERARAVHATFAASTAMAWAARWYIGCHSWVQCVRARCLLLEASIDAKGAHSGLASSCASVTPSSGGLRDAGGGARGVAPERSEVLRQERGKRPACGEPRKRISGSVGVCHIPLMSVCV